jgi:hypothetical protein
MMWLKGCPRCHGDLVLESDYYGQYATCLQCGREFATVPASQGIVTRAQQGSMARSR